jgi:large subunit ribosomal protein L23
MNEERLMNALIAPHVSEKATLVGEQHNQVVFKVRRDADKPTIRRAVEKMFEVEVQSVRVVKVTGKRKRSGARVGHRGDWKKAYVRLAPGSDIDFLSGE